MQVFVNLQQFGVQLGAIVLMAVFDWRQRRAKMGAL